MPVVVGPNDPHSTHHVALVAEDGTTLGLILCDSQGKRLPYSVARNNLQSLPVKTASGESQYSDIEPPFTVSQQSSWQSGQGQERFEDNKTKYARGRRIQTANGRLTIGPMEHYADVVPDPGAVTEGFDASAGWLPAEGGGSAGIGRWPMYRTHSPTYMATRFRPLADTDTNYIWMMGREGVSGSTPATRWHWEICADDAGGAKPGTVLDFGDFVGQTPYRGPVLEWGASLNSGPITLAAGTFYWFKAFAHSAATSTDFATMCFLAFGAGRPGELSVKSDDNLAWSAWDHSLMFWITESAEQSDPFGGHFFFYQRGFYFVTKTSGNPTTAPRLFINGWRGAADSNAGQEDKLIDATQTGWANDLAVGSVVYIIGGPGSQEETPYRYVVGSISGELDVNSPWLITHTTATNYVVIGADVWFEITGHGMTEVVNDEPIEVGSNSTSKKDMMCYFAQGRNKAIRVMREYNNAGVWTRDFRDWNPGERAEFLVLVEDPTDGWTIWKAEQGSITGVGALAQKRLPTFNYADFGAAQGFGADELIGHDKIENIVNLVEYEDPDNQARIPWIIAENRLLARRNGKWRSVKLDELRAFASKFTGKVALVKDTFLYISMAGGLLEQLTNGVLVDMGPGRGLSPVEDDIIWELSCGETYPGTMWVAADSVPLVFQHRGNDSWECVYSGPVLAGFAPGIGAMKFQKIPNAGVYGKVSRLWMLQGKHLVWLEIPPQGNNVLDEEEYQMAPEGAIEFSKIFAELDERRKIWSSLKLVTEGLDGTATAFAPKGRAWIEADTVLDKPVRIDDSGAVPPLGWGYLGEDKDFNVSPSQEEFLTDYFSGDQIVASRGKYLKLRLRMNQVGRQPVVNAMLVESVVGLPVKFSFSMTSLFEDHQLDLGEQRDTDAATRLAADKLRLLDDYADNTEAFTMRCIAPALHGKKVVIGAPQFQPTKLSPHSAETENQRTVEALVATIGIIQLVIEPAP